MNFNQWVSYNYLDLSRNYNSRDINSSFDEFCRYVYTGLKKKCFIPVEYTKGIIN